MILYTMMPEELIFPYETDSFKKQQIVSYQGISLLVELADQQTVQVIRVLSTDPGHFLNERICPGAEISCADIAGLSSF